MENDVSKYRRSFGRWRLMSFILLLICIGLVIAIIVISVTKEDKMPEKTQTPTCTSEEGIINLEEPVHPSVFHDLTALEMKGMAEYLYSQASLNLVDPSKAMVNSSYVYLAELHLPKKADVLHHLDSNGPQPPREAVVTIFRGDLAVPEIQELVVSPLPNPSKHTLKRTVPFNYRPVTGPEYGGVLSTITIMAHYLAGGALMESYGGKLIDCGDRCLVFRYITPMSPAVTGEDARKMWFWLSHFVDYFILHPLDFALLMRLNGTVYTIEQVWYNGRNFTSLQKFAEFHAANKDTLQNEKVEFPSKTDNMFSKLSLREPSFPKTKNATQSR